MDGLPYIVRYEIYPPEAWAKDPLNPPGEPLDRGFLDSDGERWPLDSIKEVYGPDGDYIKAFQGEHDLICRGGVAGEEDIAGVMDLLRLFRAGRFTRVPMLVREVYGLIDSAFCTFILADSFHLGLFSGKIHYQDGAFHTLPTGLFDDERFTRYTLEPQPKITRGLGGRKQIHPWPEDAWKLLALAMSNTRGDASQTIWREHGFTPEWGGVVTDEETIRREIYAAAMGISKEGLDGLEAEEEELKQAEFDEACQRAIQEADQQTREG